MKQGALAAIFWLAMACHAATQTLIRDAEIERTLDLIARPILQAAGLGRNSARILIVNNPRMNAFVAGGNNIFVHSGLLRRLKSIDQIRAVLAHEAGHITGGHLTRRNQAIGGARNTAGLGLLLAVASALAGGREGAAAVALLSAEVANRGLMQHSRAEESSADQAGLRYMVAAGADPRAIIEVMKMFDGQEALSSARSDPYVRTHPIWSTRLRYIEDKVASAPRGKPASDTEKYWHARMVAKFNGFVLAPRDTLRRYRNDKSEIGTLARAVAYHRFPDVKKSISEIDRLIGMRPNDPFYRELKGQFLLEGGKVGPAVTAYRNAANLAPKEALILAGLGRALIAANQPKATQEAMSVLKRANALDATISSVLRDLAVGYARLGQKGNASLATAERMALLGRLRDAQIHATRAVRLLPQGSAGWRKAQDILTVTKRALK